MFIKSNPFLDKLNRGEVVIGTELRCHSPRVAELIGLCGFDFVHIETEHCVSNDESLENCVRAAQLTGVVPLLRIPTHDESRILQVLDMGIQGLIIPHVDNPIQARAVMNAGKYAPVGERGASYDSRAAGYGIGCSKDDYFTSANKSVAIIPMIESIEGVNTIEGILDTNPDVIRIGRDDLSMSMRVNQDDESFKKAVRRVIDCATERGIAVGTGTKSPEHMRQLIDQGYRMITYKSDITILRDTFIDIVGSMKTVIEESK